VEDNDLGGTILGCTMNVHTVLGPGLLESTYEACLVHEFSKAGLTVARQVALPIRYDGIELEAAYRIDLLVNDLIILELKVVDQLLPVHTAQLLNYLKLSQRRLGYLLNFNVVHMRDGIKRVVNNI
jgi:GxxExxY protein